MVLRNRQIIRNTHHVISSLLSPGQAPDVSRWNKYVDQKENGPECNEDEHEEEESVYTDKEQYRQHNNIRLEQSLCCFFFPHFKAQCFVYYRKSK